VVVDINRARVHELAAIPGIGRRVASSIVLDRVRNGPFPDVDSLVRVDGIGPGRLASWRPFLRADGRAGVR
jgi:competence protein ComEA